MTKKIIKILFLTILLLSVLIIFFSINGYKTERFNRIIFTEVKKKDSNLELQPKKIKIKLDLPKLKIFLSTDKPDVKYKKVDLPINNIKVYLDFLALLKSEVLVNQITVNTNNINLSEIKKIILDMKPSNIKRLILNNLKKGSFKTNIKLKLDSDSKIIDYEIEGSGNKIEANVANRLKIENTNFIFGVSKNRLLFESINGKLNKIPITEGKIDINNNQTIKLKGNFSTNFSIGERNLKLIIGNYDKNNYLNNKIKIKGNLKNTFDLEVTKLLKIKNYNLISRGNIENFNIEFNQPKQIFNLKENIKKLTIKNTSINYELDSNKIEKILMEGKYSINEKNNENFKIEKSKKNKISNYQIKFDTNELLEIFFLNYVKPENSIGNIDINLSTSNSGIIVKNLSYKEKNNLINVKNLRLNKKNKILSFKQINLQTYVKGVENNKLNISFGKKIMIEGLKYDATNLMEILNSKEKNNNFELINKPILINLSSINTKLEKKLENFNLIGTLEKGKFTKLNAKGEFSKNQFLDISLKKDKNTNKKYLEIFSDIPSILLADFNFFKGIDSGKLLYTTVYDEISSTSKMLIENFRVQNAPGFVRLLSLADFGGMADLVSGDGLSFDILELKMESNNEVLRLQELYAVGPSISILMDGYVENKSGLVSLRGTMVPAKELNNLISKIPVIGKILIPKEIGEGLFGVSFKMKGLPEKIKISVNPIKTLTPRFITKALEKRKN